MVSCLTLYYDTRFRGITFDCIAFFTLGEMLTKSRRFDGWRLVVNHESFRSQTEREHIYSVDEKLWRLRHIVIASTRLFPNLLSYEVSREPIRTISSNRFPPDYEWGRQSKVGTITPVHFDFLRASGLDIRVVRAGVYCSRLVANMLSGRPFITISLRCSSFQPSRNSNIAAMEHLAMLARERFLVVWIPDFEFVHQPNGWRPSCPSDVYAVDAAMDVELRVAYYQGAVHNFCVSNGTSALLYYSQSSFSMFGIHREGVNNCGLSFLQAACGLSHGEKFWWLGTHQRIIWESDSVESVEREFYGLSL